MSIFQVGHGQDVVGINNCDKSLHAMARLYSEYLVELVMEKWKKVLVWPGPC